MHWFDGLVPLLADEHRVVRVDLLGHGGSAKPRADYGVEQQAAAVTEALERVDVHAAPFVGHSYGAAVSVAVAERRRELVARLVILDEGPNLETATDPLMTRLGFLPVLGELMHRLAFDSAIRDGYGDAFAEGFDLSGPMGEQVVRDYRAMTFTLVQALLARGAALPRRSGPRRAAAPDRSCPRWRSSVRRTASSAPASRPTPTARSPACGPSCSPGSATRRTWSGRRRWRG